MYRVNKDKYKEINLADEASFAKKIVEAREPEEEDEDINMGIFDWCPWQCLFPPIMIAYNANIVNKRISKHERQVC